MKNLLIVSKNRIKIDNLENRAILYSIGSLGTLEDFFNSKIKNEFKHIIVLKDNNYVKQDEDFETETIDKLTLNIQLRRLTGKKRNYRWSGPVEETYNFYKNLIFMPTKRLWKNIINNPELFPGFRETFTKPRLFGLSKSRKLKLSYVDIGLETYDKKYLLLCGPCEEIFSGGNF